MGVATQNKIHTTKKRKGQQNNVIITSGTGHFGAVFYRAKLCLP